MPFTESAPDFDSLDQGAQVGARGAAADNAGPLSFLQVAGEEPTSRGRRTSPGSYGPVARDGSLGRRTRTFGIGDNRVVIDGRSPASEPDYRMSLAAERTYLAYLRTGLALLASGVGVVVAAPSKHQDAQDVRRVIGVALIVLSGMVIAAARPRWAAIDRAIRDGEPLPKAHTALFAGPVLVLVATAAIVAVVLT